MGGWRTKGAAVLKGGETETGTEDLRFSPSKSNESLGHVPSLLTRRSCDTDFVQAFRMFATQKIYCVKNENKNALPILCS